MMSRRTNQPVPSRGIPRRSLLMASVFGSFVASSRMINGVFADDPPTPDANSLTVKTTPQRLVKTTDLHTIRLKPVSADFEGTVIQAIASDPRGELIAVAGDDHSIRIMNIATLQVLKRLSGHSDLIQTIQFDPTGNQLVSAGNDGQLMLWNRNDEFRIMQRIGNAPALACVRFSPDGHEMAAVGFDNQVYLIGRGKRTGRPKVECDCTDLRAVDYRSDGKVLAVAGRSGDLHLFERATNQLLGDFLIHTGRVHALRFLENSSVVVSVGEDGAVVLFDTDRKTRSSRIPVTRGKLFSVCILDHEHLAVAGSDNVVYIVNVAVGEVIERLPGHTGSIAALASSGSLLFSGGYDTTLRRWQLSGIQGDGDRIAERENPLDRE